MTTAWSPLGAALRAYHEGQRDAVLIVESDLFETEEVPAHAYYRPTRTPLPELEQVALDACRGRVLDVGAGAGRHALELQTRGLDVTALEISLEAATVMSRRGVQRAVIGDLRSFHGGPFDTVLMLMNGLGAVGDRAGLVRWLRRLHHLAGPGGVLLCDSSDLTTAFAEGSPCPPETPKDIALRRGEARFRLGFGERRGAWYRWFFCPDTLLEHTAREEGWTSEVLHRGHRGAYLARLRVADR